MTNPNRGGTLRYASLYTHIQYDPMIGRLTDHLDSSIDKLSRKHNLYHNVTFTLTYSREPGITVELEKITNDGDCINCETIMCLPIDQADEIVKYLGNLYDGLEGKRAMTPIEDILKVACEIANELRDIMISEYNDEDDDQAKRREKLEEFTKSYLQLLADAKPTNMMDSRGDSKNDY